MEGNLEVCIEALKGSRPPDFEFEAARGRDFGYVVAWQLAPSAWIYIAGDNGSTYIGTSPWMDRAYAGELLLGDDPSIEDRANVLGIESIEPAPEDYDGPCTIVETTYQYGPKQVSAYVCEDYEPIVFGSAREAYEELARLVQETQVLAPGEYAVEYRVVAL